MSTTTAGGNNTKNIYSRDKLVEIRDSMELQQTTEGGAVQNDSNPSEQQQTADLSWRSSAGKDVFRRTSYNRGGGGGPAEGEVVHPRGERHERNLERGGQQAPEGRTWDRDRPPRNTEQPFGGRGGGFSRGGGDRHEGGGRGGGIFRAKEATGAAAAAPSTGGIVRTGGAINTPTVSSPTAPNTTGGEGGEASSSSSSAAPKKNPWGNRSVPTSSQATVLASAPAPLAAVDNAQDQGSFPTFSQSASKQSKQSNGTGGAGKKAPPPPIASLDDLSSPTVASPSVAPPAPVALGDDDCGLPGLPSTKSSNAPSPASATHHQQKRNSNSSSINNNAPSPTMALGALGGIDDDDGDYPMLGGTSAPQGRKQRQQQHVSNQQQQNAYSRRPVPKVVPVTQRNDLKDSEFPSLETL